MGVCVYICNNNNAAALPLFAGVLSHGEAWYRWWPKKKYIIHTYTRDVSQTLHIHKAYTCR